MITLIKLESRSGQIELVPILDIKYVQTLYQLKNGICNCDGIIAGKGEKVICIINALYLRLAYHYSSVSYLQNGHSQILEEGTVNG